MSDQSALGALPDKTALEALVELIPRLDRLVSNMELDREQSSETIALLRGKANDLLWSGTVVLKGSAGSWSTTMDFTVPFARVAYIDSQSLGPYVISTDAMGGAFGPGVYNSFPGGGDAGTVPLIGRHLSITCANAGAGPISLFVAVFTTTGSNLLNG
jgi:hypothetical protein